MLELAMKYSCRFPSEHFQSSGPQSAAAEHIRNDDRMSEQQQHLCLKSPSDLQVVWDFAFVWDEVLRTDAHNAYDNWFKVKVKKSEDLSCLHINAKNVSIFFFFTFLRGFLIFSQQVAVAPQFLRMSRFSLCLNYPNY